MDVASYALHPDGLSDDLDTPGHLCSCEGAVVTGGGRPSWKLGKEKMFGEGPNERHVGATLLYMGGGSGADERLASPLTTATQTRTSSRRKREWCHDPLPAIVIG
nr:unnamed protein product [Digitaria exilis]